MPLKNALAKMSNNDDDLLRVNKLNENFRLISDALSVSAQGEQLQASRTVFELMPENTETSEFFDVIYPIGAIIQTTNAADPRLLRGVWNQITANSLGIASDASSAGTTSYSTYYSLFLDNSSVESQVTSYLLSIEYSGTGTIDGTFGPVQIAAILGNIKWESNFSTGDLGEDEGGENFGLFSFAGSEGSRMKNACYEIGVDPYTVEAQMRWVFDPDFVSATSRLWYLYDGASPAGQWHNRVGNYTIPSGYGSEIVPAGTTPAYFMGNDGDISVEQATYLWMSNYEGCGYSVDKSHLDKRLASAQDYYDALVSDYSPTSILSSPVVARAFQEIGKPYLWGACGPDSFDCSGLVSYCLCGTYGTRLGTTETFMTWPQVTDPQPGDICTTSTHCGIYIGLEGQLGDYALKDADGNLAYPESTPMMINAPHSGAYVEIDPVQSAMIYVRYQGDIGAFTGNSVDSDALSTNGYSTGMYASSTSTYNVLTYERIA